MATWTSSGRHKQYEDEELGGLPITTTQLEPYNSTSPLDAPSKR